MAEKAQILNKIARNLDMLGIANTRLSDGSVVAAGLTVGYDNAVIAGPMGGVDGSVSPYLGIGIGNPGQIHITTGATVATSFGTQPKLQVLHVCAAWANDINVQGTDATIRLRGNVDLLGMGQ